LKDGVRCSFFLTTIRGAGRLLSFLFFPLELLWAFLGAVPLLHATLFIRRKNCKPCPLTPFPAGQGEVMTPLLFFERLVTYSEGHLHSPLARVHRPRFWGTPLCEQQDNDGSVPSPTSVTDLFSPPVHFSSLLPLPHLPHVREPPLNSSFPRPRAPSIKECFFRC